MRPALVVDTARRMPIAADHPPDDPARLLAPMPDDTAEGGRGLVLMRVFTDGITVESTDGAGTVVHLQKRLALERGSPLHDLHRRSRTA